MVRISLKLREYLTECESLPTEKWTSLKVWACKIASTDLYIQRRVTQGRDMIVWGLRCMLCDTYPRFS